jgi:hypothetical protein
MSNNPKLTDAAEGDYVHRLVQPLLEVKLGTNNPRQIIINLLAASHPSVRDATDETLVAAFLDMDDADEEIRDTAQAVLEARKYIRESQLMDDVMAAIRACPDSAQLMHLPYGGYVIEDGGQQLGSGVTPTDAWLDAAIPRLNSVLSGPKSVDNCSGS